MSDKYRKGALDLEMMQATCFHVRLLVKSLMDQVRSCPSSYRQRQNVSPRRRTPCGLRSVPSSKHSDLSQKLSLRPPRKTLDFDHGRDICPLYPRPPCHVETTTSKVMTFRGDTQNANLLTGSRPAVPCWHG